MFSPEPERSARALHPAIDDGGRLGIACRRGHQRRRRCQGRSLAEAGVDVLVVDTAHGHQAKMLDAIRSIAALDLGSRWSRETWCQQKALGI